MKGSGGPVVMDSAANGATKLDPVDGGDASLDGTSAETTGGDDLAPASAAATNALLAISRSAPPLAARARSIR
jgi:hypothetical protein